MGSKSFFKKKLSYIGFGGHGNQVRDVLHIDDVCDIIYLQIIKLKKINNQTFNIGGSLKSYISLKNLTKKCEKLTNNKIKFKKIPQTSNFDIPYYITDNKKVRKFYKWHPKKNINLILNDIYKWLNKNKNLKRFF